jgi:predicted dinucleotide-binding enzyme
VPTLPPVSRRAGASGRDLVEAIDEDVPPEIPGDRELIVNATKLNTMNCDVMVDPAKVPGEHDVFVCGEDADAKRQVSGLLESFGWPGGRIRDLGGIESAGGTEMYVALWLRLWGALGTGYFNIQVVQ